MLGSEAWYVFGVTPPDTALPAGVDPTPLAASAEGFVAGGIQAVVSRVPLDDMIGDGPQDPAWLVPRVRAHDRVLTTVAATHPVVPFRFGVVHSTEEAMAKALADNSDRLAAALRRVGKSQEWTVSIEAVPADRARAMPPSSGDRGRNYLLARQAELTARDRIDAAVSDVRRRCEDWHISTTTLPPGADGAGRVACLIPRAAASDVRSRLESPTAVKGGIRITVLGPLPPYHFVDHDLS